MEKYSSGLVSESFWFVEFKQFIKLRVDGKSWDEIKELCLKDNLLGIPKEYRAKRVFGYLKNRVQVLQDDQFLLCTNQRLRLSYIQQLLNKKDMGQYRELFTHGSEFINPRTAQNYIDLVWKKLKVSK